MHCIRLRDCRVEHVPLLVHLLDDASDNVLRLMCSGLLWRTRLYTCSLIADSLQVSY